jgi:hypothetical protein
MGLLIAAATPALSAVDWHEPWTEPRDFSAAAMASDEYAWRLFVALNWPADLHTRQADRGAAFGSDRPVVWETWLAAGEVYLGRGADPGPWSAQRVAPAPARRFESVSARDLPNLRRIVAGVMVPVADPIADARRLTEIHMNRATFEFIRAAQLYSVDGQLRAYAARRPITLPYGAREVKAKWRPISESERSRYHTMQLTLADGTRRLYGLTALHIASKDLPNWFWSTFEHVDNPTLADSEGWQLPSRDRFACRGESADCNRSPADIGLAGTVWRFYRLRGTLTQYTDARGQPQRLANSELEFGMQRSASCITCHSRASIGMVDGKAARLPIFAESGHAVQDDPLERQGFIGAPTWLGPQAGEPRYAALDFVWSMRKAQSARAEQ